MQFILKELQFRIKDCEHFESGQEYEGFIDGYPIQFVEVKKAFYKDHMGYGMWFNKGLDFKVLH